MTSQFFTITRHAIPKLTFLFLIFYFIQNLFRSGNGAGGGSDVNKAGGTSRPVIIVPGGGLDASGNIPDYVKARMDKAIEIYQQLQKVTLPVSTTTSDRSGPIIITLSAGTPHVPPPRDQKDFPLYESSIGASYLLRAGIPAQHIFEEKLSLDTLGNAYFLRTIHTDLNKWTNLIIITNNWHMDRVKAIFSTIFSLPRFYSHDNVINNEVYKLQFVAVDALITPEILQLRQEREKKSLLQFVDKTAPMFHTLQDVHNFLFLNHKAYSVERLSDGYVSERIDPELLKSY